MKKIFFTLMILVSPITLLSQGLNSITTPDGVNIIAVGNQGRIYRSSNSGNNWNSYIYGSAKLNHVYSLGNNVWIASEGGNVYKTAKVNSTISIYNIGSNTTVNSIVFTDSNTGYLCGEKGTVYKSINGGQNWSLINSGISNENLNSVSFKDGVNGVVAGDNGTVYLTDNGGTSWIPQTVSTTRNLLKAKYFADGIIVVGEYGVILTKESAGSWTSVNTRTDSDIRGVSGTSLNNAHVCGGGGFIRNNTNGRSNFFNFEINPMLAELADVFYYNSNIGFAVSSLNYAIIKTTNAGQSWALAPGGNISFNWVQKSPNGGGIGNNLCPHPTDRNSSFVVYGNKVYVSRDRGESWIQIATISIGTSAHSFYVSPIDTNVMMAAMESNPDRVVRSTNYGATWTSILQYNFSSFGQPLEMDQNNPNIYYFAPDGPSTGFFKSTDNGASFTSLSNSNPFTSPCDIIVMWDSANVLYVGDDGADIFKSVNNGANWTLVKPQTSSEVPSMCNSVFDKSICYATTWGSNQVFRTVNHGDNWNIVSVNSGSGWGSDVCREDPTVVLTGNYGSQAYLSTNGGLNFFNINTGLSGAGAGMMVRDRSNFLNMQTGRLFKLNINYNDVSTFTTFSLFNPPNNSTNNVTTLNFNWQKVSNTISYKLQISNDSLFNSYVVNDSNIVDTSRIINSLSYNNVYFWRVGAKDSNGVVVYSLTWKFGTTPISLTKVNPKILMEGMYFPAFNQMIRKDTVTAYLHQSSTPYSVIDSAKTTIDSVSFSGLFQFYNAPIGTYYIAVKHFNCIETWSKTGGEYLLNNGTVFNYDFTTTASQAFGSNLKLKGSKYCIISGDVNQDGFIDGSDFLVIDNDAYVFLSGRFIPSDLNGDNFVDAADMQIGDNNRNMIVITP